MTEGERDAEGVGMSEDQGQSRDDGSAQLR